MTRRLRARLPAGKPEPHLSPAVAAALARRRLIEQDRRRAPALLAELRALPPSERESTAATAPRFRSVALVEILVAESLSAAAPDLAVLALRIAGLLDPSAVGAAQVEHLSAASWAAFADARRRAGNLVAAERAFECAARHLASDPDPLEEASFCRLLALFRRDRGEQRAALAAQWRAVRLLLAFAPPRAVRPALAELAGLLIRAWIWRARRGRRAPEAV
ncbi:MAG TPA: hypothetical protein VHQ90_01945 [Thermoanaerobaculia bacterium]|nr:hypothetical protein [Thermoanaerobaculia bacterium]